MMSVGEKWQAYHPSKGVWFWSCVASCVLTMIVGFSWGGWVTGGSATEQADLAAKQASAQLAANICVHRFLSAPNAASSLAELKKTDSWKRDSFVSDGGWVTFAKMEKPVAGAADLCAEELASAELPVASDMTAPQQQAVN
ncbi:hypothetical protein [Manganibacter manganicus]|nr:hypothetical protein [Pseudaminobacter manganicus]